MGAFFVSTLTLRDCWSCLSILLALVLGFAVGAASSASSSADRSSKSERRDRGAHRGVPGDEPAHRTHLGYRCPIASQPVPGPSRRLRHDPGRSHPNCATRHDRRADRGADPAVPALHQTKIGLAMRAVANNQESSNLVGIRTGFILILGWGLLGSIAVLAAAMLRRRGPHGLPDARTVPAGVGGRRARWSRSTVGAVVGGLIVGLVQAFLTGYHPSIGSVELTPDLLFPVMLVILLGVLLFRARSGSSARRESSGCDALPSG